MKKQKRRDGIIALGMLAVFILWTAAVSRINVQAIGPENSSVGFSTLNAFVHRLTGVHWTLYTVTDWLGLVPLCVVLGFGLLGLAQWIKRKHLLKVDRSILCLGGFYIAVMAAYVFFEQYAVNYRPVLINGLLEVSYPSSTNFLVLTVMPTAVMQWNARIKNAALRRIVRITAHLFTIFMVIGRLLSGVHWITDIIGGMLLSAGLVSLYHAFAE